MGGMNASFSLMGMWATMNWVARGVVIVLLLMSIWSLTIAVERAWRFYAANNESVALAREITPLLKEHNFGEAIIRTRDYRFRHSHLGRVLNAGLTEFQFDASQDFGEDFNSIEASRRAMEREAMMTATEMRKGLGTLATISTTAPFIGLFGTVMGIVHAFQGMAISGSGGLGPLASGIAEALATTAAGLIVAIPTVWLYNVFLGRVDRFQVQMSNSSSQLVDYFTKNEARGHRKAARA